MEQELANIYNFAFKAHGSQKRKYTSLPYMVHPLKVMETCKEYTSDKTILAAALLHDVLEDTAVTENGLKDFLITETKICDVDKIIILVKDLTDVFTRQKWPGLNRAIRKEKEVRRLKKANPDAQTIKYADLLDNATDITRHDPDFAPVYLKECQCMLSLMKKGNRELHERARHVTEQCLASIYQESIS